MSSERLKEGFPSLITKNRTAYSKEDSLVMEED